MKQSERYKKRASFLALAFVLLGYTVAFYPQYLIGIDQAIQSFMRESLDKWAILFWTRVTLLGNASVLAVLSLLLAAFCWHMSWKAEAYLVVGTFVTMGLLSTLLKILYHRPRPTIPWLIDTVGYSFPSWHAAASLMVAGLVALLLQQREKRVVRRRVLQLAVVSLALVVGLSRIVVGVHYPTDILAGWLLAGWILHLVYPFYERKRFVWRFQRKQQ